MPDYSSPVIVLGTSMAGLLSAKALSNHFQRVTLVERDVLPEDAGLRKGVPQSAHAHGLLASGYRVMDDYFPGMMDELEALGAPRGDVVGDFLWFQYGRWKWRHQSGLCGITVSRPCLEAAIRCRVKALPNPTFSTRGVLDPGRRSKWTSWSKGLHYKSDVLNLIQELSARADARRRLGRQRELELFEQDFLIGFWLGVAA